MLSTTAAQAGASNPIGALIEVKPSGNDQHREANSIRQRNAVPKRATAIPGSHPSPATESAASTLPDDPALPGLRAIRDAGLADVLPALGLGDGPLEMTLCGHHPGSHATLEARAGAHHFAIKISSRDPAPEASIHPGVVRAVANDPDIRVPALLAWDPKLKLMAFGWLEGPSAKQLIDCGRGERAGKLAARWVRRAASLTVPLGPQMCAGVRLNQVSKCAGALDASDLALGTAAVALTGILARTHPQEEKLHFAQGSLHARHLLDLGECVGVLDWRKCGQGPLELDAGTFLAAVWRLGLLHPALAGDVSRATTAFLETTADLLDPRALAWYRAAMLVRLARRETRGEGDWRGRAHTMLGEAWRLTDATA